MTDKLQLMLINVVLDQFLNTKVSQGSVATRLIFRFDGIFNDQFITQSEFEGEKNENRSTVAEVMGN